MHVSPRVRLGVASTSFLDVEYRRAARRRRTSGQAVEGKRERRGTPRRVLGALGGRGGARPAEHLIAAAAAARARARVGAVAAAARACRSDFAAAQLSLTPWWGAAGLSSSPACDVVVAAWRLDVSHRALALSTSGTALCA
mmetsp:Transcript_12530/g.38661  ORF Transcript_12530/g.38661 Transcript_12530/m.38661 type:complete len:141 (+) Transcript_12530:337-759(+)